MNNMDEYEHFKCHAERIIRDYCIEKNVPFKDIAQLIRVALTGTTKHMGIFEIMYTLGREETLRRLAKAATS